MTQEWPRRAIGKLVQSAGGPIQGPDFQTTGRSAQPPFPDVGDAVGFPALGITNQEKWTEYPRAWEGGGLYLRPRTAADGTIYLIASRVRPYPEYPEKLNSRQYIETLHAAHPVATVDFPSLFELPDRLVPKSLTAVDSAFPPVVLDGGRAVPLPPGWFEQGRAMLVALVAGTPLDAHDYTLPAEEFFARALRAVACLPGTVRWRVGIAAGVYAVPPADKAGVRYALGLSFQSRGAAGPVAAGAGEAYARWFAEATEAGALCNTIQDILELVAQKFPLLTAWDAMPASGGWEVAVQALAEMRQLEILTAWARAPNGRAPGLDQFLHLRPNVLELVAGSLDGPAAVRDALLPDVVGQGWERAWQRFAPLPGTQTERMAAVGQLLGTLSPLDPASIARRLNEKPFELPAGLHGGIRSRLSAAFDAPATVGGAALAAWEGLLRRAFADNSPAWFAGWVQANADTILWRAVRLRFVAPGSDATTSWKPDKFPGGPAAVQALLKLRPPTAADFEKLLLGKMSDADRTAAQRLIEHIEGTLPESALRLALVARHERWLSERTRPEVAETMDKDWVRAVAAVLVRLHPQADQRLAEFLLSAWNRLASHEREKIRPLLRQYLGPLDSILFGDKPQLTDGPVAPWVWPIAGKLCEADTPRRRKVLEAACRQPGLVTPDFQKHLLTPVLTGKDLSSVAPATCATLQFALALRDGPAPDDYPAAQGQELEAARLWLPLFEGANRPKPKAPDLRQLNQFPIAVLYRQHMHPFPPKATATFWAEWLQMIATPERQTFLKYVQEAGLKEHAFWRFAAGWKRITELREEELNIIKYNNLVEKYLRAVSRGDAPMHFKLRNKLEDLIPEVCETPEQCWNLYQGCKKIQEEWAAFWIVSHCLEQMKKPEVDRFNQSVDRGLLATVVRRVSNLFGPNEPSEAWHQIAVDIYKSTNDNTRNELDKEIKKRSEILNQT